MKEFVIGVRNKPSQDFASTAIVPSTTYHPERRTPRSLTLHERRNINTLPAERTRESNPIGGLQYHERHYTCATNVVPATLQRSGTETLGDAANMTITAFICRGRWQDAYTMEEFSIDPILFPKPPRPQSCNRPGHPHAARKITPRLPRPSSYPSSKVLPCCSAAAAAAAAASLSLFAGAGGDRLCSFRFLSSSPSPPLEPGFESGSGSE